MPSISATTAVHPLASWRMKHLRTLEWLGAKVGTKPQCIHRYEHGERIPTERFRARIERLTKGKVRADVDFWLRAAVEARSAYAKRADARRWAANARRRAAEARLLEAVALKEAALAQRRAVEAQRRARKAGADVKETVDA